MARLSHVSKAFGHIVLFNNLSYQFTAAKSCIIGDNGTGKTTLLLMLAGVEKTDSGSIMVDDNDVSSPLAKSSIGLSSDKIRLPEFLTAKQLLSFHCHQFAVGFPHELVDLFNFDRHCHQLVSNLSLGNLKKLSLICAFAHQPSVLLLDEPTTGLDHQAKTTLLNLLADYPGQVIVTSHDVLLTQHNDFEVIDLATFNR